MDAPQKPETHAPVGTLFDVVIHKGMERDDMWRVLCFFLEEAVQKNPFVTPPNKSETLLYLRRQQQPMR